MTIWTPDNTPNSVCIPPAQRGCVALFYKPGPPSKICPGQLLLLENYRAGITRNLAHWGYRTAALAVRPQSAEEHNHAALCARHLAQYYQSWDALITDERRIHAAYPALGTAFLDQLTQLARLPDYPLRPPQTPPIDDDPEPQPPGLALLTADEQTVAAQTATAIGLQQLILF